MTKALPPGPPVPPLLQVRLHRRHPSATVVTTLAPTYRLATVVDRVNAARQRDSYVRLDTLAGTPLVVKPAEWDSITVTLAPPDTV